MIVLSFNVKEKKKCVIVEMNSIVYPQQRNERNLSIETDQCKGVSWLVANPWKSLKILENHHIHVN